MVDVMKEGSDSDAEEAAAKGGVNSNEGREEVYWSSSESPTGLIFFLFSLATQATQ